MFLNDLRRDWMVPGDLVWVADLEGAWRKGAIVGMLGMGYAVQLEGDGVHNKREHEIRPRDLYCYSRDKPETCPGGVVERRR
ncbi:MAG TPA: hypothetical protein P5081_20625 [Phycisphaerae bacterium]|nr:hypothetical protein [Phycisphaerae bacterium]HRW55285.1 hypothetical protein [Phycisphaerae bacterium]